MTRNLKCINFHLKIQKAGKKEQRGEVALRNYFRSEKLLPVLTRNTQHYPGRHKVFGKAPKARIVRS